MEQEDQNSATRTRRRRGRRALLALNSVLLSIGSCGGPLIMRLYFIHGGGRVWLSAWLQTGGWPVVIVPVTLTYLHRRHHGPVKVLSMKPRVLVGSAAIGVLLGFDNYMYAYGVARLPVSTSSLIVASQLAFTAVFAFVLAKHEFTAYSINSVVLLTIGAVVLGIDSNTDRPEGEGGREYFLGFVMTVAAAGLYGLCMTMVEVVYKKAEQIVTYSLVMEIQMVISLFATVVCTVGMLVNNDFKVIPREAKNFDLGETKYYVILAWTAIICQCFFMGAVGVIFCSSSLFSGIIIAVLIPITEVLAVIFYKEKFGAQKGVALALSLWGFVSYFYGEMKHEKKIKKRTREAELAAQTDTN